MPDFRPVATSVTTDSNSATIKFEDGHRVTFKSFDDVLSRKTEGLRHFWLYKKNRIVVQYHGQTSVRTRHLGPSENEHCFIQVTRGYTRERIVAYWEAAVNFVDDDHTDNVLVPPIEQMRQPPYTAYSITQASLQDLSYIKDKLVLLPDEE